MPRCSWNGASVCGERPQKRTSCPPATTSATAAAPPAPAPTTATLGMRSPLPEPTGRIVAHLAQSRNGIALLPTVGIKFALQSLRRNVSGENDMLAKAAGVALALLALAAQAARA